MQHNCPECIRGWSQRHDNPFKLFTKFLYPNFAHTEFPALTSSDPHRRNYKETSKKRSNWYTLSIAT